MSTRISLFFLLLSHFIFAQNLEFSVIVKDVMTGQPIEEVTITALKTKQGFLTNKAGEAVINLSQASDLKLEHFTYKPYVVKFCRFGQKK